MPALESNKSLQDVQQWMLEVLVRPGSLEHKLRNADVSFPRLQNKLIKTPPRGRAIDRLDVYAQGYLLRLQQCLKADFPATFHLMGESLFNFFTTAYIWQHPSKSSSLYDMGAGFARFLEQSQGDKAAQNPALQVPLDIARLERGRTEVIRAQGVEGQYSRPLDPFSLLSGQQQNIYPAPCLRLFQLSYPLIEYIDAIEREQPPPPVPSAETSYIAITRKHYHVSMSYLEHWQYILLKASYIEQNLAHCISMVSQESGVATDKILAQLMVWLPIAYECGWLWSPRKSTT